MLGSGDIMTNKHYYDLSTAFLGISLHWDIKAKKSTQIKKNYKLISQQLQRNKEWNCKGFTTGGRWGQMDMIKEGL